MFTNIRQWIGAFVAAVMAGLLIAVRVISGQRDRAREKAKREEERAATAEKRIEKRKQADDASYKAKAEGDKRVQEAIDRARDGKRDHFTRGLRDD